jgi:L-amino acid N-acyltransferase YncA
LGNTALFLLNLFSHYRSTEISVYINLAHHRRGLGAVMLEEMLRIAKEMKLRSIIGKLNIYIKRER